MRSLFVVVVAACSGAAPRAPLGNVATTGVRPTCSDDAMAMVSAKLVARWRIDHLNLRCAAGHFAGADALFVEAQTAAWTRVGVVDASGADLVPWIGQPVDDTARVSNYQVADLDGDGDDEIVESWHRTGAENIAPDNWLVVRRIADGKLSRPIRGPCLRHVHTELGGCSATWSLRDNSIVIAVLIHPGIPPTDCLPEGRHRFALRGNELVER